MTFYELLLFLHILGAATWFGAGLMLQLIGHRADRAGDEATVKRLLEETEALSKLVFIPASLVVLAAGIAMVIDGPWSFGELWIVLGLVGFAATVFTGAGVVQPRAERIAAMIARDGGLSPTAAYEARRMMAIARIDYVTLGLVFAVMAMKPTGSDTLLLIALAAVLIAGAALVITRAQAIAEPEPAVTP
jgi:uncharacterized membrane protein